MLILGIILVLVGWLLGIGALEMIGIILVILGAVLMFIGTAGPVHGRWW